MNSKWHNPLYQFQDILDQLIFQSFYRAQTRFQKLNHFHDEKYKSIALECELRFQPTWCSSVIVLRSVCSRLFSFRATSLPRVISANSSSRESNWRLKLFISLSFRLPCSNVWLYVRKNMKRYFMCHCFTFTTPVPRTFLCWKRALFLDYIRTDKDLIGYSHIPKYSPPC